MDEEKIINFWANRKTLNEAEWTQLYHIVHSILKKCNISKYQLDNSKKELIDLFFQERVFLVSKNPKATQTVLNHPFVLHTFFNRFLLSIKKQETSKKEESLYAINSNDKEFNILDLYPTSKSFDPEILASNYGYSLTQISKKCLDFLNKNNDIENILLCQYALTDNPIPLNQLASIYNIKSINYKAWKLGIRRQSHTSSLDDDQTVIKKFLSQFGLSIKNSEKAIIKLILSLLSEQADKIISQLAEKSGSQKTRSYLIKSLEKSVCSKNNQGLSVNQISQDLNISKDTTYKLLKLSSEKTAHQKKEADKIKKIVRLYKKGYNIKNISLSLGLHRDSVTYYLKKCKLDTNRQKQKTKDLKEQLVKLEQQGLSINDISKELNISKRTLVTWRKEVIPPSIYIKNFSISRLHRLEKIKELLKEDVLSKEEISKKVDISLDSLYKDIRCLRKYGYIK